MRWGPWGQLSPHQILKRSPLAQVTPNCRVALRNDSYTLHKILPNKVDPLVSLMMVEKVPDSTYEMIGGLDKQIKEIKEVIELPVKHPELFDLLVQSAKISGGCRHRGMSLMQKVRRERWEGCMWAIGRRSDCSNLAEWSLHIGVFFSQSKVMLCTVTKFTCRALS